MALRAARARDTAVATDVLRKRAASAAAVLDQLDGAGIKLEDGALGYVYLRGFADCALLLCQRGTAIDQAYYGSTPLHVACVYGQPDCMRLLCEWGAAIDQAGDNGVTPLHAACRNVSGGMVGVAPEP